jgi:hypothetical protein
MGSILSKISDDEEDYSYLCKKYSEPYLKLYSAHHDWLEEKDRGKTTLTFEEYSYEHDKKSAIKRVDTIDLKIRYLKAEKQELRNKYKL